MTNNKMIIAEEIPDYIKDLKRGNENVSVEDLVYPLVLQAQGNTDVLNPKKERYIDGLKTGEFYNTITNEIYGESMDICFVTLEKFFIVRPYDKNKNDYYGSFMTKEEAEARIAELDNEGVKDLTIKKSINHYGYHIKDTGEFSKICIPLRNTKLNAHKQLNTIISLTGRDRFASVIRMSSIVDVNKEGQEYYTIKFSAIGYPSKELYTAAEKMYEETKSNQLKTIGEESTEEY